MTVAPVRTEVGDETHRLEEDEDREHPDRRARGGSANTAVGLRMGGQARPRSLIVMTVTIRRPTSQEPSAAACESASPRARAEVKVP